MKKVLLRILKFFNLLGINPDEFLYTIRGLPLYLYDLRKIFKQKGQDSNFYFGAIYPVFRDRFAESGTMSGHYFHQDLLVARKIFETNPERHLDMGSRTDGFVAHVASFRQIEIIDIRENKNKVTNILFRKADLMKLPVDLTNCCDSISALHSIEHFGLGRYGDPIDYYGHLKAIENITQMLKIGGKFYFSVPIGKQRIEFNAHRVFSVKYLLDLLLNNYSLNSFSFVDDKGNLFENVELSEDEVNKNFNCHYGCGIFELTKI